MKQSIIICGYPKSGNTWLTRLSAEILHCPVAGFWCAPFKRDESVEGLDRQSHYQCFKAHHAHDALEHTLRFYGNGNEKVIYIYRDPRAVAVSAFHYFSIRPQFRRLHALLSTIPLGLRIYFSLFHADAYRLETIVKGLVEGTSEGGWLQVPWHRHVEGYLEKEGILTLSYETLKADTLSTALEIVDFLGIRRSEEAVNEAIQAQSFERKKQKFQEEGNTHQAQFLRRGQSEAWREELPGHHIRYIEQHLGETMRKLGYRLGS